MNDDSDSALRARFSEQKRLEHEATPEWRLPIHPVSAVRSTGLPILLRWAAATALILLTAVWLIRPSQESLASLPSWPIPEHGQLFSSIATAPSTDFLLPIHINIQMP